MLSPKKIDSVLIFGGGGLVGYQIARLIAQEIIPKDIIICTLLASEADDTVNKLRDEFVKTDITFHKESGNIFVRQSFANKTRTDITGSEEILSQIYDDVFGDLDSCDDNIRLQSLMPKIISHYKPDVVVDCVNTATAISYQDVKSSSKVVKEFRDQLGSLFNDKKIDEAIKGAKSGDQSCIQDLVEFVTASKNLANDPLESFPDLSNLKMIDLLLISQSVPQLVRHVTLLYHALVEARTNVYIKVGTTGTGGMGVNIPYTHGEEKPSFTLMAKSSVGFAHTGLLFLLARSPGPIIKEIKPGAMIGHRRVVNKKLHKFRQPVTLFECKQQTFNSTLNVRECKDQYQILGETSLVGVDTGENGFFTRGEYEAITYLGSMEFVTPEEIAKNVLYEICGDNTGKDIIAAIDGAIMDPSYRAGYIRQSVIDQMLQMEEETGTPSIAIGELGPPQLSKLLYEIYLLKQIYPSLDEWADTNITAEVMSKNIELYLMQSDVKNLITSLGLAILLPDGKSILRGHNMYVPESKVHSHVSVTDKDIDTWAKQGWIDLRKENFSLWKDRAKRIISSNEHPYLEGSANYSPEFYTSKKIKEGEIVGWIFSTELAGSRHKSL